MRGCVHFLIRRGSGAGTMHRRCCSRPTVEIGRPSTIAALLPLLTRLVKATTGTEREAKDHGLLARVLISARRTGEAEALLRPLIEHAAARGEFHTAAAASSDLANLLRDTGRLPEALQVLKQGADYTTQAGSGPWTQLLNEAQQLQIRDALDEHREVLTRVVNLRERMRRMPDPGANDELIRIWNVRELIFVTGAGAAAKLGEWQQALALNAEAIHSKEQRGVGAVELAQAQFNGHVSLLGLKRYGDALKLLDQCREVFEHASAVAQLGGVYSGLAALKNELGQSGEARHFEQNALRYHYAAGTPQHTGISHFNLANYLTRANGDWREVLGHRLAAAMLTGTTGSRGSEYGVAALAGDLHRAGNQASAALPSDFLALCFTVQQVERVRFRDLMLKLQPDEAKLNQLLQNIIAAARTAVAGEEGP